MKKFSITGTDTDVGKTFITRLLLAKVKNNNQSALAIKPISAGSDDAVFLQQESSIKLPYEIINPFCLREPLSPHIAAKHEQKNLDAKNIYSNCLTALQHPVDYFFAESAGGWLVPINDHETMADVAVQFNIPVIVVVNMRLGCINHTLLTVENIFIVITALLLTACQTQTEHHSIEIPMSIATAEGVAEQVGTITISETPYGLLFTPDLKNLPTGLHGFHLHEYPSCEPMEKDKIMTAALAAGGHFDPKHTGEHQGPYGSGHLGDLPALYVDNQGVAQTPVLAPRISTLKEINNTSLMIHVGGDNYSDHPHPLGGGGVRMVCGVKPV